MGIKLICGECGTNFSCERAAELKTRCPNCGSGHVRILSDQKWYAEEF